MSAKRPSITTAVLKEAASPRKFLLSIAWNDEFGDPPGFQTTVGFISATSEAEARAAMERLYRTDAQLMDFLVGQEAYVSAGWEPIEPRTLDDHFLMVGNYKLTPVEELPELDVRRVLRLPIKEPSEAWLKPKGQGEPTGQ